MVKNYGLTHIALAVANPERSLQFYEQVLGVVAVYRGDEFIQAQTLGSRDVLVFERKPSMAGPGGGIIHFGFRLHDPADIAAAVASVERAGGAILSQGDFLPF